MTRAAHTIWAITRLSSASQKKSKRKVRGKQNGPHSNCWNAETGDWGSGPPAGSTEETNLFLCGEFLNEVLDIVVDKGGDGGGHCFSLRGELERGGRLRR